MSRVYFKYLALSFLLAFISQSAFANCGAPDYGGSQGRLYDMVLFITTMCAYTLWITSSIAGILSVYCATQVYIKMQTGEDGIMKSIITLIGAALFLLGASMVMPAFFGFEYGGGVKQLHFHF